MACRNKNGEQVFQEIRGSSKHFMYVYVRTDTLLLSDKGCHSAVFCSMIFEPSQGSRFCIDSIVYRIIRK